MAEFLPITGATTTISATNSTGSAKVRTNADSNQPVRVWNSGAVTGEAHPALASITIARPASPVQGFFGS